MAQKMTSPEGAGHSFSNRGYPPVGRRRRVPGWLLKRRASTGRAKPSRLAAAMERAVWGSHACLSAATCADRNVRATLGHHLAMVGDPVANCRYPSIPVDTCRYPPAVPVVPVGTAVPAVPGSRARTRTRTKITYPSAPLSLSTKCGDKVWRQGVSAEHPLKPKLNLTLKRHTYSTRLLHILVH